MRPMDRSEAEEIAGGPLVALRLNGHDRAAPVGPTPRVLMASESRFYPMVEGIPVLLRPEVLGPEADQREFDLEQPAYHEAYLEMDFYNQVAGSMGESVESTHNFERLQKLTSASPAQKATFPHPHDFWIDARHDGLSQVDAFEALAPIAGKRIVQGGGKGQYSVMFLLADAAASILVTPMLGEAVFATKLAAALGVGERFLAIVSVAEELPLGDGAVDGIYAGGCAHHYDMSQAMPEAHRVLTTGGVFAAVEPFRAPLYSLGTRIFGKREPNAFCTPMTHDTAAPLETTFEESEIVLHGTLFRYGMIAASKAGVALDLKTMLRLDRLDDKIADRAGIRKYGSSVALIGRRTS